MEVLNIKLLGYSSLLVWVTGVPATYTLLSVAATCNSVHNLLDSMPKVVQL